jgi:hypothetical protein
MTESPIFVARFADGEVTRMTTYTSLTALDVGRGVRLAHHAYRSRKKLGSMAPTPPIIEARFERLIAKRGQESWETLATYDAAALADWAHEQKVRKRAAP